jgi:hypothetical protein
MSIFTNLFRGKPSKGPAAPEARATLSVSGRWDATVAPRVAIYPPVDPGFPAVSVDEILHGAQLKIQRLAEIAGGTASEFERLYIGPLRSLAAQVHLLPATPFHHYSAPAGLFNMCLDIGLMARQAAEGKIFVPEATIEVRHRTEGAWRYSAFLAGLLCQLHVPVGSMTVTDTKGVQWPRYGSSIASWLADNNLDRYFVTWHEKARVTGAEGASLLASVVPGDVMNWLASSDSQIIRDLNIAVTREMNASESILGAIVRSVTNRVKEVDAAQQACRFGRLTVGTQFEVHMLNAMRELIENKTWKLNEMGSNLYWGSDGLYVAWPQGLKDVLEVFDQRGLLGMPRSSVTLAELLGLSGVVISKDAGVWVHDIVVPFKKDASTVVSAMRFKDPVVLVGHLGLQAATHPFGKLLVDAQAEQLSLLVQNRKESPGQPLPIKAPDTTSVDIAPPAQVTKPERSEQESTNLGVALLDHVEDVLPGKRVPIELLARLKLKDSDDAAIALGMAIEQSLNYRGDRVRTLEWGVAICIKWLTEVAGFDVAGLASPLDRIGVIAKNPESRNVALISNVTFSDSPKPRMALAIKLDFAAKLGMAIDAKV